MSKLKLFLSLAALLLSVPAGADELENMKLKYEAYYKHMKAGEMVVFLNRPEDGKYEYTADVETNGLAKYVTKYWSRNSVKGEVAGKDYNPRIFETTFQPKKKVTQNIVVNYAPDGKVTETAEPPENRKRRPEVEEEYKTNVPDPITAVMVSRERIREIIEKGASLPYDFEQPVFDGRRTFIAKGQIVGYKEKRIDGKAQKLLHLHGQRVPQSGFHPKELEKIKGTEPVFDIYLDNNYIPVLVEGRSSLGDGTIILANKCSGAECRL